VDLKASGAKGRTPVLAAAVGIYLPLDLVRISSARLRMRARALLEILL
jgi:uncharacterized oligopeptide transporter (OPT) family protein